MSGAALTGLGEARGRRFVDDYGPRRAFGRRKVGTDRGMLSGTPRSVDSGVADLRRRIDESQSVLPARLPLAIGAALIGGASVALWVDAFQVATNLARDLAALF